MLAALLCNLEVTPIVPPVLTGGGVGGLINRYVERQARKAANARRLRDEELRARILDELREEQEQVAALKAAAVRLAADVDFQARLERAASELAALELEALKARSERLRTILNLAEAIAAELDDEEAVLVLM